MIVNTELKRGESKMRGQLCKLDSTSIKLETVTVLKVLSIYI